MRCACAKRERVDGVCDKIVADVINAGPFVTSQAVDVLWCVRLATPNRPIIDRVRIGVTRLERQAVAHMAREGDSEPIIKTGSYNALVVHRAIRIATGE